MQLKQKQQALMAKYNVQGPRYTSYPTVPYWEDTPTVDEWLAHLNGALVDAAQKEQGAAVYIHIPFCESLCTYCGCTTKITKRRERGVPYIQTVLKEWQMYKEALWGSKKLPLAELHLGGGTPTWLSASELQDMLAPILADVALTNDAELSLEVDPRVTTREQLKVLADLGFRRISMGVQDFDPGVQAIVNRMQTPEQVKELSDAAREFGFTSVNYDLIYGLPLQTKATVANTIETVRQLKPDRIAYYGYAHVPWIKPGQRKYTEDDLPNGAEKLELYELGLNMLAEAGFHEIGMDHFALKTDGLYKAMQEGALHRNFMGYMPRAVNPMISLGMSAISDAWTAFAQNAKTVEEYEMYINNGKFALHRGHILSAEDQIMRRHILNVMTKFETSWQDADLYTPYLDGIETYLAEALSDGLVVIDDKALKVSDFGRPFLRNICMAFDARLARKAPERQIFSKVI